MRDEDAWVDVDVRRVGGRWWRVRRACCLRAAKERGIMVKVFVVVLLREMVGLTLFRRGCEVEVKSDHGLGDMVWYRDFRL